MPWRDVFILSTCRLVNRNPQNLDHGNSDNGNHEEDGGDENYDVEDDNDDDHDAGVSILPYLHISILKKNSQF